MRKEYLLTPGPTPVPDSVRLAEAQPIIHHRTKEYSELFKKVSENLKPIFKTRCPILTFASSGTGAMEGTVSNMLSHGDTALVIKGGKFAERWGEICEAYGVRVIPMDIEWGTACESRLIEQKLKEHPDIKALFATLCETSTGTVSPIEGYGKIIKERENTILVVDAISGLGGDNIEVDDWNIDVCVSGSQKGLMLPPGLAFTSVSDKAWRFAEDSNLPKYYFDFRKTRKSLEKASTPYTPAISLTVALNESLEMLNHEGIDTVLANSKKLADATRTGIKALGLELLSRSPANTLTAIKIPDSINGIEFKDILWNKYGINVAGGQAQLKGKIIRIAHLGYMGTFDIITAISGVEMALKDLGYPVELGKGVKSAEEILS